jgi:hypothetical protein
VVSRKAIESPAHLLSLSACFQAGIAFIILPLTPLLEDGEMAKSSSQVWVVCVILVPLTALMCAASLALSQGAKWVPASMSATTDTATLMASGYLVEAILFNESIEVYPMLGALMMLMSVVIMAVSRVPAPMLLRQNAQCQHLDTFCDVAAIGSVVMDEPNITKHMPVPTSPTSTTLPPTSPASEISCGEQTTQSTRAGEEDVGTEKEGLVSFIASEFVDTEPQARFPLRKRLPPSDASDIQGLAWQLGAASVVPVPLA